ncbi:MAG: hypothetical protein IPK72_23870 [Candidatus Eisenbacteria bacterium]|nr:hypothetical protein [Candidatus Eisenbacteria bacterium]
MSKLTRIVAAASFVLAAFTGCGDGPTESALDQTGASPEVSGAVGRRGSDREPGGEFKR